VVSTSVGANVRRRYHGVGMHWSGPTRRTKASGLDFPRTIIKARRQDLAFERSLTEKLSLRMGYDYLRQRGNGGAVSIADFERDLWSIQFSYKVSPDRVGAVRAVKKKYAEPNLECWQDYWRLVCGEVG